MRRLGAGSLSSELTGNANRNQRAGETAFSKSLGARSWRHRRNVKKRRAAGNAKRRPVAYFCRGDAVNKTAVRDRADGIWLGISDAKLMPGRLINCSAFNRTSLP